MMHAVDTDAGIFSKHCGSYELSFLQINGFMNRSASTSNSDSYMETMTGVSHSLGNKSVVMYGILILFFVADSKA